MTAATPGQAATVARWRKRPAVLEGLQWTGANRDDVEKFTIASDGTVHTSWASGALRLWSDQEDDWLPCPVGHTVMHGVLGEFYGISPEALEALYEPAAIAAQQPQPAPDLQVAGLRADLTEMADNHNDLLNEILLNTGDEYDGDEAAEAIAVRYVRDLEAGTVRKPVGEDDDQPAPELADDAHGTERPEDALRRIAGEAIAALAETRQLRELAAEILAAFSPTGSGHAARVGQVQIAKWRKRAGLET